MLINGKLTKRPAANHPDPQHWQLLREAAFVRFAGQCGCCPASKEGGYGLELHHRHYDTFGAESIDDVILLCRQCHEAITSRLRQERPARSIEFVRENTARPGRVSATRNNLTPIAGMESDYDYRRIPVLPGRNPRPGAASDAQRAACGPAEPVL